MSSIVIALALIGFIALVVGGLMYIHKRDQKAEAKNKSDTLRRSVE